MTSYYTVVQFVPDPLTDERINVGVIAFDDEGNVDHRLLSNWNRVRAFTGRDIKPLRSAVENLVEEGLTADAIRSIASEWRHSVQLTDPRVSLTTVDELLDDMTPMMLVDPEIKHRRQNKLTLLREAREAFDHAFLEVPAFDGHELRVESKIEVPGRHVTHAADLAVTNGHLILAAQAVSFVREPSIDLRKDVSATAWTLEDVGQTDDAPKLAVLVAPPADANRPDYVQGTKLFKDLGADVIKESGISGWANKFVKDLQPA